jgi:tetratricopeptide (TPR) repeat protein
VSNAETRNLRYTMRQMVLPWAKALLIGVLVGTAHWTSAQTNPGGSPVDGITQSLRNQNFDDALRDCDAALKKTPKDKRIWALRGIAYAGKGEPSAALDSYRHALGLDPAYLPALEGAAQIEYQQRSPRAKPLILRVLAQLPNDPTSHTMLAFLEYAAKDCAGAVPHFEKGGEVLANQPMALAAYGACRAQAGQYDQAIPLFQRALSAEPSVDSIRFDLALAQWKANDPEDALLTLQPVIEDGTGHGDALLLAADIYESKNDTQHAVDLLRKAILSDPRNVDAYLDFANLSYDHASMQVGIDILNAGIGQLPTEARLYLVRGILYTQLGKFDESAEDFGTANRLDPGLSVLGAVQGLAASQQHKSIEALAAFRAAAKAQPKDALTQYLFAEALSQESPHEGSSGYAEEVAAAKRACELDPSMAAAHDLLATIYLRDGHTALAIEQSNAALAVDPKDQQAIFHLVLGLRKTGQKDRISSLLKQLAALRNPTQSEAAQNKRYQLQEITVGESTH